MEHSLNQRDGRKPSPASIEGSSTIKQEPLDEEMKEPKIEIPQEASFWECGTVDPLKEEIDIGETGFTVQDPFFMIEEIGIKVEPKVEKDEEIEDHGDTVDTTIMDTSATEPRRRNKTTSDEDRHRVVTAYENGASGKDIAKMLNIKRGTVYSIIKKYQKTWEVSAAKRGGNRPKMLSDEAVQSIRSWIDEDCTLTMKVLVEKVHERYSVRVSTTTIAREIKGFNFSFKRIHNIPERRNTDSTIEERKSYAAMYYELLLEITDKGIVFLNETGLKLSMRTSQGRSQPGTTPSAVEPQLRSKNISIICAMNKYGIVHYRSHNRAITTKLIKEFVLELKAKLRMRGVSRSCFIMDDVEFHKSAEVQEAIGNEEDKPLYLPSYSHFLNPIENMFSEWKKLIKRSNAQSEQSLMEAIASLSMLVSSQDCEKYFRNMGTYLDQCLRGDVIQD
ncbi:uncharacterized protein LOC125768820 isoform X3 [Anopheles funestus]|uniref:uncharacterized protein LOC125768820 isoform X3 n=1 Tax=Anopheles funestus TaxID=62324 RepID=UPI0020C61F9A|nr:uncharacterized protein LOC125768820 isoform X3 [Anopheles funestus]